jgi:hypothetical protein
MASRIPQINPAGIIAAAAGVGVVAGIGYLGYGSIYSGAHFRRAPLFSVAGLVTW